MLQFNFLFRLLSPHQRSKQIDSFCCSAQFFFHSICVCMHGCLCVHASEVIMVTLPWLCLWHSCVQRYPHRCPGSHSAFNTDAKRLKHSRAPCLCFLLFLQTTSGMESQNLVDDLSPKKNTVLKVCVHLLFGFCV